MEAGSLNRTVMSGFAPPRSEHLSGLRAGIEPGTGPCPRAGPGLAPEIDQAYRPCPDLTPAERRFCGPYVRISGQKRSGISVKNQSICPDSGAGISYNFPGSCVTAGNWELGSLVRRK